MSEARSFEPPIQAPGALLTVEEMYAADRAAIEGGSSGATLMENAGAAVVEAIVGQWTPRRVLVLCGPGNNGGDGFVVARLLAARQWPVRVALLGEIGRLTGEAALNAKRWTGEAGGAVETFEPDALGDAELIVDAVFGAGLTRDVEGAALATLKAAAGRPIVAVDVPSGVHGDSGAVKGFAAPADLTVTFFRAKPGHYLLPGRQYCGRLVVADIGIPDDVLQAIMPAQHLNDPGRWRRDLHWAQPGDHKYSRGYALVVGGPVLTGASRLAARAAQRAGAGAVALAAPVDAQTIYKVALESVIIRPYRDTAALLDIAEDPRLGAVLVGPGAGVLGSTRERTLAVLRTRKAAVLDADALSIFEGSAELMFEAISAPCVLTPHDGEFARLFPDLSGHRLIRARMAAARSGAVVLLKGYDTVIAAPDGRAVINANAPADLATAGAGDVLAGILVALLAQGVDAFAAAQAATWMHGEAARRFGVGLVPEDLIDLLPAVLRDLRQG